MPIAGTDPGRARHYRACASSYAVGLGINGPFVVMGLALLPRGNAASWQILVIGVLGCLAWSAWLACFRLTVASDSITYRAAFRGTASIRLRDIRRVRCSTTPQPFKPTIRLEIDPYDHVGGKPIVINLKVLGRQAVKELLEFLADKAGECDD